MTLLVKWEKDQSKNIVERKDLVPLFEIGSKPCWVHDSKYFLRLQDKLNEPITERYDGPGLKLRTVSRNLLLSRKDTCKPRNTQKLVGVLRVQTLVDKSCREFCL